MRGKIKALVGAGMAALALGALAAPAASANFTSAGYPANITGHSASEVLHLFGTSLTCTGTFAGTMNEESPTLTIAPKYENCTFGGFPATVSFTSCDYVFHTTTNSGKSEVSVECTKDGDEVDITIFGSQQRHEENRPLCHYFVPEQTGLTGHQYTNGADGTVTISGNVSDITATQERTSFVCPQETHTDKAEYTIQKGGVTFSGDNGAIEVH